MMSLTLLYARRELRLLRLRNLAGICGHIATKYRFLEKPRANDLVIKIQVMFSSSHKGRRDNERGAVNAAWRRAPSDHAGAVPADLPREPAAPAFRPAPVLAGGSRRPQPHRRHAARADAAPPLSLRTRLTSARLEWGPGSHAAHLATPRKRSPGKSLTRVLPAI